MVHSLDEYFLTFNIKHFRNNFPRVNMDVFLHKVALSCADKKLYKIVWQKVFKRKILIQYFSKFRVVIISVRFRYT